MQNVAPMTDSAGNSFRSKKDALNNLFALQLDDHLIKYRREYAALPQKRDKRGRLYDPYHWDFAIEPIDDTRLLVEVNGGTWSHMGHSTGGGIQRDYAKANAAVCHGYRQLTFTTADVEDNTAIDTICRVLLGVG